MTEERDENEERFYRIIREMLNEAMKSGRFPDNGNFSITIAGGNLPIDIIPPEHDSADSEGSILIRDVKPHTEIQMVSDSVIISADLPGAKEENTAISVEEDYMIITSLTDETRYSTKIKIPPIRKETLKYSLNNGLLEVSAVGL